MRTPPDDGITLRCPTNSPGKPAAHGGEPRRDGFRLRRVSRTPWVRSLTCALFLPALSWAQTPPPTPRLDVPRAGQALRDVETTRPALPPTAQPELDLPAQAPADSGAADAGPRVAVHTFTLSGNTVFDTARLTALLADLVDQELSFAQLQEAAARVTTYYRTHGYVLARAYLPHQDIDAGAVRIDIMEGRYGQITLDNRSRVLGGVLRQPLHTLQPGAVVQGADLEQSLMLLDELPGVTAKGTLRAGTEAGTTDLVVDAERAPFASGSLEVDNFGAPSSGRYRATGGVEVNSPLRLGDQLTLRGLASNDSQRYYRAAYQLPVGPASTRVGVSYSNIRFRIGQSLEFLRMYNRASVQSAFIVQPLLRSRRTSLNAQIQYDNKNLHDGMRAFDLITDKNVGLWSFGIGGRHEDAWLGGGRTGFSATLGFGRLRANDPLGGSERAHTLGSFTKLNLSVLRLQALGARLQLYTQFSAQLASRNLDSSEQFSLGGPYGVRAFALGAGYGDQGWQGTAELRYLVMPGLQLSTFADTGRVQITKQPLSQGINTYQLSSIGVGANWYGDKRQLSISASRVFGAEQRNVVSRSPDVWFQASQYF
jgi:hemolysin activation/secretion protein